MLMRKNDMSRCIKQNLSLQMAETGSGQLETQMRFMERCDRAPGQKGGQGRRASGGQAAASRGASEMHQHHSVQLLRAWGANMWAIHTADDLPAQQPEERATRHDAGESQGFSGERGERSQAPEDAHCALSPAGSSRTGGVRNQTSGCPRPPRGRVTTKGTGSIPGGQECPGGHTGMRTCPKSPSRVLKVPARHRAWHLHVIII